MLEKISLLPSLFAAASSVDPKEVVPASASPEEISSALGKIKYEAFIYYLSSSDNLENLSQHRLEHGYRWGDKFVHLAVKLVLKLGNNRVIHIYATDTKDETSLDTILVFQRGPKGKEVKLGGAQKVCREEGCRWEGEFTRLAWDNKGSIVSKTKLDKQKTKKIFQKIIWALRMELRLKGLDSEI